MIAQVVSCHVAGLEPVFRSTSMGFEDGFAREVKAFVVVVVIALATGGCVYLSNACEPVIWRYQMLAVSAPPQTRSRAASVAPSPSQVTRLGGLL